MDIRQIQSAYDGYPLTSTVIFLGSLLLAAILFKWGNRAVKGLKGFWQRLLPAYGVVMLLLAVNLLWAFNTQGALQGVMVISPVSSSAALRELGRDKVSVLTGVVSPDNDRTSLGDQEYVVYIGERTWRPIRFLVESQGDKVSVSDYSYTALNWPRYRDSFGDDSVRYLDHGQPVVVVGKTVATTQRPFSNRNADTNYGIDARVVYAGSHSDFIAATERRSLWPRLMTGLNSFVLGAVVLGSLASGLRRLWQLRGK